MNLLHITAECYPIAKVGGLADVVGALPKYQNNSETSSKVIMPFYDIKFTKENSFKSVLTLVMFLFPFIFSWLNAVLKTVVNSKSNIMLFFMIWFFDFSFKRQKPFQNLKWLLF